jgi:hypothetical protein
MKADKSAQFGSPLDPKSKRRNSATADFTCIDREELVLPILIRNEGGRCSRFVLLVLRRTGHESAELGTLIVDKKQTRGLSIGAAEFLAFDE